MFAVYPLINILNVPLTLYAICFLWNNFEEYSEIIRIDITFLLPISTPGEEVVGSNPAVAACSQLVG